MTQNIIHLKNLTIKKILNIKKVKNNFKSKKKQRFLQILTHLKNQNLILNNLILILIINKY